MILFQDGGGFGVDVVNDGESVGAERAVGGGGGVTVGRKGETERMGRNHQGSACRVEQAPIGNDGGSVRITLYVARYRWGVNDRDRVTGLLFPARRRQLGYPRHGDNQK